MWIDGSAAYWRAIALRKSGHGWSVHFVNATVTSSRPRWLPFRIGGPVIARFFFFITDQSVFASQSIPAFGCVIHLSFLDMATTRLVRQAKVPRVAPKQRPSGARGVALLATSIASLPPSPPVMFRFLPPAWRAASPFAITKGSRLWGSCVRGSGARGCELPRGRLVEPRPLNDPPSPSTNGGKRPGRQPHAADDLFFGPRRRHGTT